jgi:CheY-like chemotaxis protein
MPQVTILVVDDDDGHTELVRRNLKRSGINSPIVALTTGIQALDYVLRRNTYANRTGNRDLLVLLDINMPGLDGVEVLRQIKADAEAKKVPVLMLTTTDDPREINRCYELGCNVYITKPIDPAAFMAAIQRLGLLLSVVSIPTDQVRTS